MRTEDGHLVSKCLSGEPETFGLLVDKYKSAIYGFAYARLGDFQDAEDLTQEVFLRAYQKLHNLKHYDSFLSWLYAIASNLCKKLLNAKARRVDQQYLEDQQESVWNLPSLETYHRKQKYQSLYEALAELPEIYRQVLTLYYLGGMNTREIARFFGTSKNTIESRLRRARAKLKEEMITMMRTTFDEMKLQPGFTFRVVEALKQTKIQTAPYKTALPYGVSAAAMMIALLFALTVPYSPFYPIGQWIGSTLPSKTQVVEDGVIPVDTMDVTKITILTSENEDGDFGQKPQPERARMFASAGGKWEKRADMPKGRAFLSGAALDGEIYAVGGFGDFPEMVGTMEAYDPKTDTWEKRANMPTSRSGHAVVALNGKLYAIGGFNNPATFEFKLDKKFYGDLESERISAGLRQVFLAHGITPSKISIRRWGGWRITDIENHRTYGVREEGGELNVYSNVSPARVEVYDPSTDMWTRKADLPTPRSSLAAVALDGKIYTIGGARGGGLVKTVEVYDPGTDTWTKKADLLQPREQHAACVVNGKIYVFGGQHGDDALKDTSTEMYDPATDTWTKKADMLQKQNIPAAAVLNGEIYVIGAWADDSSVQPTVEAYNPVTDTWTPKPDMPTPRTGAVAATVDGVIYVIGGMYEEGDCATVEVYNPN